MSGEYQPCTQYYSAWLPVYAQWESAYNEATALMMDMERDFNDLLDTCVDIVGNPFKVLPCATRVATFLTDMKRVQSAADKARELKEAADVLAGQLMACINAHQNSRAILPPEPDETEEVPEPAMEFPPLDLTQ